jgi:acetyltransferase-like isoleucine patch superfamily enzyme
MTLSGFARVTWAATSIAFVESVVFGLAGLPAITFFEWALRWKLASPWLRVFVLSLAFIPSYLLFTLTLIVLSAGSMRLFGWKTPENAELAINKVPWALMNWVRYRVSIQLVCIFAGSLFRATPAWSLYLRLNGARIGRHVFVNSLGVTDHNLLEFGDDVVIGGDAHLSGHTVEDGVVKTARVRLGRGVTVGVGSVIGIGVEAGDGCQIGALSLVPKFTKLREHTVYAGIPVREIEEE